MAETGLGRARLEGELERTWRQILLFARLIETGAHYEATIDTADPDARPVPRADLRRMMVPIGPVLVFAASNFPFAFSVAGGDTASALAAGCPVICKAHPGHPGTSELVGHEISQALADAGLDAGTFSLVQTESIQTALDLVGDDAIEAVAFTGSTGAGRAIFDAAGARERPIPVFAEMGSTNPVVVTGSALEERGGSIATALAGAITRDAGQLCTKPGVIMVPHDSADEFRDSLREAVLAADTGVMLNQRLYESAVAAVDSLSRLDEVAPVLSEAAEPSREGFGLAGAIFATSSAALRENPDLRSERFGPISLLVTYDDLDDLLATIDGFEGQLTATLHATSADEEIARRIVEHLLPLAGRLVFDGVPDRGQRDRGDAARRAVSGDDVGGSHVGRERGDPAFSQARCVAERARVALARAAQGRKSPRRPEGRRTASPSERLEPLVRGQLQPNSLASRCGAT